ncbi:MAG TPA: hypothetical protein DEB55_12815, partial [Microbacterium sp.]|nr:hypothetical protein [Microbacterium sp.]
GGGFGGGGGAGAGAGAGALLGGLAADGGAGPSRPERAWLLGAALGYAVTEGAATLLLWRPCAAAVRALDAADAAHLLDRNREHHDD